MAEILRYDLSDGDYPDDDHDACSGSMYECADGEYVKYEDHIAALRVAQDEIERLRTERNLWQSAYGYG